jgi:adenosine 3'-phospho 5'-phosphosulfate transporter B3
MISLGMVFFAAADFHVLPTFDFIGKSAFVGGLYYHLVIASVSTLMSHLYTYTDVAIGIILVCISVIADAFLPNFQERVFDQGSSRLEVTFFTNILCLGAMTVGFTASGDLPAALSYALANPYALSLMAVYTFLAYIAITFHMALVKEFGGITTVLVGNARKAMTIVLSFLLFPKPTSYLYAVGGFLVFGSLVGNAYMKDRHSNSKS